MNRLWTRFGDGDEYDQHGDDLSAVASALISNGVKEIFRRVKGGIEANGFEGPSNYISLYWGDKDANFVRELTGEEFKKLASLSLNESFKRRNSHA